jgi:hypothetical protein
MIEVTVAKWATAQNVKTAVADENQDEDKRSDALCTVGCELDELTEK